MRNTRALFDSPINPIIVRSISTRPATPGSTVPSRAPQAKTDFQPPAPAPPSLPKEDQAEWRKLQKSAEERSQQVYFHPDVRRKPQPEFEGDRNPVTGEVGGPKNDPLRHGDYSFGGRVTDF
ncbi:hypothetical protein PYCC9005_000252 [Savitreella phatthalungensis]